MNAAKAPWETLGEELVKAYYNAFDTNREQLLGLYSPDAMFTFEEHRAQGQAGIKQILTEKLRFTSIQHLVTKVDCQPTAENGILVLVTGRLKHLFLSLDLKFYIMFRSITGFFFHHEETASYDTNTVISHDSKSVDFLDPNDWVIVEESLDYRSVCNERQNSCIRENEFITRENDFVSDDLSSIQSVSLTNSFSGEHSDFERLCGPYVDMRELDPQGDAALSDVSSQPELLYNPSIEECWIVSPSPCFIGQDVSLEKLKSSSMEDLLIEHPSMSIYKSRGRRPLRDAINESQPFFSDEHKNAEEVCSSIGRNCESLENLEFLLPREHASPVRNDRLEQSSYWTSDSDSSSLNLSLPRLRSRGDQSLGVAINSERQNLEDEELMNESSDSLNSGRDNLHRKCHNRVQVRVSHVNVERNNKALQQQSRKKRRYRRMCYSSFNSPIGKKKGS